MKLANILNGTYGVNSRLLSMFDEEDLFPYLLLLPFFTVFIIFWVYPIVWAPWMSLHKFSFVGSIFVGFDHYLKLVRPSGLFVTSLVNTMVMALIIVPVQVVGGILLAVAVNSQLVKLKKVIKPMFIMPMVVSSVIVAAVFSLLLHHNGIMNALLETLVGIKIPWLTDPIWAKISVALAFAWRQMGLSFLIYFAGLQGIDRTLYEAAEIDGANRFQKFRHITVPQLRPITTLIVILATLGALKMFGVPLLLTDGGPGRATETIMLTLYETAFRNLNLGEAAAMGVGLTVVLGIIMIIQYKIGARKDVR